MRRIGFHELNVRGQQKLAAFAERRGWSKLTKLPSDHALLAMFQPLRDTAKLRSAQDLLEFFQARSEPGFFAAFTDPQATVRELRTRWPRAEAEIIELAERIAEDRFDLLGLRKLSFGRPVDWHLEPISAKRTPLIHWSRLDYLDSELAGDKKIIWELNRHQYFTLLGQAYWLSGDERYAQTFVAHLESWMDQNPPKLGINWASSLEIAFRSISWLWALHFFKTSDVLLPNTLLRCMMFLYLNARHLETYLSTYFSPNTHLTGEALGLFYLGTLLPEFKESKRWQNTGLEILTEQLLRHVKPDGVYFEQSSYYHRYTTDFYLHLWILLRANSETMPAGLEEKLTLLLDHLMYITRPDGTTPFIGDDDGGRLVKLDRCPANDFRATLSTGASLFERSDYKFVAGAPAEETLWLLGPAGVATLDGIQALEPGKQSVAFEDGGYYVMRDSWTPEANYLLFDCGPHGTLNGGHAHADALSFELAAHGRTLIVDPGTYTYTGSKHLRDSFRSSAAHNTLTVDREPSSVSAGPFSWKTMAECTPMAWRSQKRFDFVAGEQDGYQRLSSPATHTRSILFIKNDYWILRDHIASAGDHLLDLRFHLDPRVGPLLTHAGDVQVVSDNGTTGLQITAFAKGGNWNREEGWVSDCYGNRKAAAVFVFSAPSEGPTELITFLLPQVRGRFPKPRVREIEAIAGRAFEVESENGRDIIMLREFRADSYQRIETARLVSDFDWTWVRFSREAAHVPEELVLIGGQRLELEGREILMSTRRIDYLVASRVGEQFRVETDEGIADCRLPIADFEMVFSPR